MRLEYLLLIPLTLQAQDTLPARLKEAAMGKTIAGNVLRSAPPVDSLEIQAYVSELGAKLVANQDDPARQWTFSIVTTGNSNALHEPLSLPGRYIIVPLDLLLAVNDESEFAAVLAQAIARNSLPMPVPGNPVVVFADSFRGDEPPPQFLESERKRQTHEADIAAVSILLGSGFDPVALLRYISRIQPSSSRIASLRTALSGVPEVSTPDNTRFIRIRSLIPSPPSRVPPPSLRSSGR